MQYERAIYQSKEYEILYIYESGNCELKEVSKRTIILVPISDLQLKSDLFENKIRIEI